MTKHLAGDSTRPATTYVFAEDYCRAGPVYPPGTLIALPRAAPVRSLPQSTVTDRGRVLSYAYLPYRPYLRILLPAGTLVEITGSYVENGVCDLWPVRFPNGQYGGMVYEEGYLDEWDLAPEFPNQVAPLPPERQSITVEVEAFCRSNPNYDDGEVLGVSHDSPLYSHRRGYPFDYLGQVAASTEVEITGPPVETGVCDMWPIKYAIPGNEPADVEGAITEEEAIYGPVTGDDWDAAMATRDRVIDGYIHESDLRPVGN